MHRIDIFEDQAALMTAAADYVLRCYDIAITDHRYFTLVLSGGSTPRALYEQLATAAETQRIDWSKVYIFWGDERAVPPEHADSNYRMARETLLDRVALPAKNIYPVPTELEPEQAAARYEQNLRAFFAECNGIIRFDLVLLGMGDDGHTASLFPYTAALDETERLVMANYVPKLETWRITLTAPVINNAASIMFLVAGAGKAQMLKQVLQGPPQPRDLPAQMILAAQGELVWLVDREAAALLDDQPQVSQDA